MSPQLLLQHLKQGFETCYTVQTCIEHVSATPPEGFETCYTVQICIWHVVSAIPPTVFDCKDLELATEFRYALDMCIKKTEFLPRSLMQNYVPFNDIHIWTISHCSFVLVSASPSTVFDAGISNLQHSSDMH